MSDLSMLINGLKVTAEKNATFERRNPLDGTVATRAPAASAADAVMVSTLNRHRTNASPLRQEAT